MRWAAIFLSLCTLCVCAKAQDIQGLETCTAESRMERRTGCLQSNTEYLHQLIRKNAAEAEKKLSAAGNEIAALKAALSGLQQKVEELQKSKTEPKAEPKK